MPLVSSSSPKFEPGDGDADCFPQLVPLASSSKARWRFFRGVTQSIVQLERPMAGSVLNLSIFIRVESIIPLMQMSVRHQQKA